MTLSEAQQTLLKWQERRSTILVRLDVKEASTILFGTVNTVMDDRVILDGQNGGHLRISLIGGRFNRESKFGSESFTLRYSTGYCTFIGASSGQDPEWPEVISEFEE